MRRRLSQIGLLLAAIVALACIVFWVRSYAIADYYYYCSGKGSEVRIYACQGNLIWRVTHHVSFKTRVMRYHSFEVNPSPPNPYTAELLPTHQTLQKNYVLFRYGDVDEMIAVDAGPDIMGAVGFAWGKCVEIPLWTILSLSLLPFGYAGVRKLRRRTNDARHLCAICGYDLRAHHPGDKCPECGTPIGQKEPS